MDRFHIEINCQSDYLSCEGGLRDATIKTALQEVIKNLRNLRDGSRCMPLRDINGNKIGYARYEQLIDY